MNSMQFQFGALRKLSASATVVVLGVGFVIGTAICVYIRPHGTSINENLSYYGNFINTAFWYYATFLGCAYLTLALAEKLPVPLQRIRVPFRISSLLLVAVAATPTHLSKASDVIHDVVALGLFFLQLGIALWITRTIRNDVSSLLAITIEVFAGTMATASFFFKQGHLFQYQVLFQLAFCLVIRLSLRDRALFADRL